MSHPVKPWCSSTPVPASGPGKTNTVRWSDGPTDGCIGRTCCIRTWQALSCTTRTPRIQRACRRDEVKEKFEARRTTIVRKHPSRDRAQSGQLPRFHQVQPVVYLEARVLQHFRELRRREPVHGGIVRVVNQVAAMLHDPIQNALT